MFFEQEINFLKNLEYLVPFSKDVLAVFEEQICYWIKRGHESTSFETWAKNILVLEINCDYFLE